MEFDIYLKSLTKRRVITHCQLFIFYLFIIPYYPFCIGRVYIKLEKMKRKMFDISGQYQSDSDHCLAYNLGKTFNIIGEKRYSSQANNAHFFRIFIVILGAKVVYKKLCLRLTFTSPCRGLGVGPIPFVDSVLSTWSISSNKLVATLPNIKTTCCQLLRGQVYVGGEVYKPYVILYDHLSCIRCIRQYTDKFYCIPCCQTREEKGFKP